MVVIRENIEVESTTYTSTMELLSVDVVWLLFLSNVWKKWDVVDAVRIQLYQKHFLYTWQFFKPAIDKIMEDSLTTSDFCALRTLRKAFHKKTHTQPPTDAEWRRLIPDRAIRNLIFNATDPTIAAYELNMLNQKQYEENNSIKRTKITRTR